MYKTKHNPDASKLIDNYINTAEEFARPICHKLRTIILTADSSITEDWKWGPNYYKDGMICGYGAFKKHVNLHFFKGALLKDSKKILSEGGSNLNGRGMKFYSADEINEKVLISYIKEAVKLNTTGIKPEKRELEIPADLEKILTKNKLFEKFKAMAYTHKKEYILWITEAKKEETRQRRLKKATELIKIGKKEP